MSWYKRVGKRLKQILMPPTTIPSQNGVHPPQPDPATDAKLRYLMNEVSDLRALIRYLLPNSESYQDFVTQTYQSFNYQWQNLSTGQHLLSDPSFKNQALEMLKTYTTLPSSWFAGKKVLDAGCGNGRWTWALCKSGAHVTALDQSDSGVKAVKEVCQEFKNFEAKVHDILKPLGMPKTFDLVWSYGVVHHTGNTWRAIKSLSDCVKPGGYLFMMIYGEPRWDEVPDFNEVNEYTRMRRLLTALSMNDRVEYLKNHKGEAHVHGWFDAASPRINDLHRFDEISEWLQLLGFADIKTTVNNRNLHLIARRT